MRAIAHGREADKTGLRPYMLPANAGCKGTRAYREISRGGRSSPEGICAVNAGGGAAAAMKELVDAGDQSGIAGITAAPTQHAAQALQKLLLNLACDAA
jgi:hypothetical protein